MATQRHPTRCASRVTRSKRGPRVSTTVEYKMAVMLFWSLYIFTFNIYFSCNRNLIGLFIVVVLSTYLNLSSFTFVYLDQHVRNV